MIHPWGGSSEILRLRSIVPSGHRALNSSFRRLLEYAKVAEAHVLALEADFVGHEAFKLAQPTSRFKEATAELVERNFGSKVEIRGDLSGNASPISTAKAQRMLSWEPRSNWTDI